MAGLKILLAGGEFFLDLLDQVVLPVRNRGQQPDVVAVRRIHYRQKRKFRLNLGRGRRRQHRNSCLHGFFTCLFAAQQTRREEQGTSRDVQALCHPFMVRSRSP